MAKRAHVPPFIPIDFLAVAGIEKAVAEWETYRGLRKEPVTEPAWLLFWNQLRDICPTRAQAPLAIRYAMARQWRGIYQPKEPWEAVARLLGGAGAQPGPRGSLGQLAADCDATLRALRPVVGEAYFAQKCDRISDRESRGDRDGLEAILDELRAAAATHATSQRGVGEGDPGGASP